MGLSLGFFGGFRHVWVGIWADLLPGALMLLLESWTKLLLMRDTAGWVDFPSSFLTGDLLGRSGSWRGFLLDAWMSVGMFGCCRIRPNRKARHENLLSIQEKLKLTKNYLIGINFM